MAAEIPSTSPSKWMMWGGYALSLLPVLALCGSAFMKFKAPPEVVSMFVEKLGWRAEMLQSLGVLEIVCTLLYLIPGTSVLGAILLTGYLGGAFASHLRTGEFAAPPLVLGVFIWGGIFLRDERIRALIPWKK